MTAAPAGEGAHLAVKRGHHGRFRFVMTTAGARPTGEVRVDPRGDRNVLRARALDEIAVLAAAFSASLAGLAAPPDEAHPPGGAPRAEAGDAQGASHGQV